MRIGRRALLKGGAVGVAASTMTSRTFAASPRLVVFDSRLPASLAFAGGEGIDVAHEDASFWRGLREVQNGPVAGLTRWSDFVTVRGFLEERGLRLKTQTPLPGQPHIFRWEMA